MRLQLLVSISVTWISVVLLIQVLISLNLISDSHSHSIKRSEEVKQLLKAGRCRREVLLELVGEQCSG